MIEITQKNTEIGRLFIVEKNLTMFMSIHIVKIDTECVHNYNNTSNKNGINGVEKYMKLGYRNPINLHTIEIKNAIIHKFFQRIRTYKNRHYQKHQKHNLNIGKVKPQ